MRKTTLIMMLPTLLAGSVCAATLPGLSGTPLERLDALAPRDAVRPLAWRFSDPEASAAPTALLEAALVPGLNQARRGEWVKAGIFLGVEVLGLAMQSSLNKEGDRLDRDFRTYADSHWDMTRYLNERSARGEFAHEEFWYDGASQTWVEGHGSHVLPVAFSSGGNFATHNWWQDPAIQWELIPTQQFYEMIGKYAQFQRGWDDYGADRGWTVTYFSPNSDTYQDMRTASNDKLKAADAWVGLVVANHAVSLLETVMVRGAAKRRLDFSVRPLIVHDSPVNTLQLGWRL